MSSSDWVVEISEGDQLGANIWASHTRTHGELLFGHWFVIWANHRVTHDIIPGCDMAL